MSWGKPSAYFETPNPVARIAGGGDWDVVFFTQAFANAFQLNRSNPEPREGAIGVVRRRLLLGCLDETALLPYLSLASSSWMRVR